MAKYFRKLKSTLVRITLSLMITSVILSKVENIEGVYADINGSSLEFLSVLLKWCTHSSYCFCLGGLRRETEAFKRTKISHYFTLREGKKN